MMNSFWFLVEGAVVLIVLLCAYLGYPIIRAIFIDRDLMRKTIPYEQHPQNPLFGLLVAGDSTAMGTGSSDSTLSTAGRLGSLYPSADIENISENGMKIEQLREKLNALPQKHYRLILLQIGANDVIRFTRLQEIRSSLRAVLAIAAEKADKTIILTAGNIGLAPLFHSPLSMLYTSRTRRVRSIFMEEIKQHRTIAYVDLFKEAGDDELSKNISRYYASDLLHLTGEGYGVWFNEIEKYL